MTSHKAFLEHFLIPTLISIALLAGVYALFGTEALFTALILVVLEVTLSFDNAVVNARVLEGMSPLWQGRFLTWGILFAVFGTRVVLPVLIVAASTLTSPLLIATMALFDPAHYAALLEGAAPVIASFGGTFLTMVGLKYFFDDEKEVHWLGRIERRFASWGSVEALEIALVLTLLGSVAALAPEQSMGILVAGLVALVLFIVVQGVATAYTVSSGGLAAAGFALFVYLNVLDAAFSLDSVVGAFALSSALPVIVVGLGIGAYFVRALTLYMVRHGTLDHLVYVEHGAHWAILGLAAAMFANIFIHVPELVTGLVGLVFVGGAYLSSLRTSLSK